MSSFPAVCPLVQRQQAADHVVGAVRGVGAVLVGAAGHVVGAGLVVGAGHVVGAEHAGAARHGVVGSLPTQLKSQHHGWVAARLLSMVVVRFGEG